jgi:hypothetical protein
MQCINCKHWDNKLSNPLLHDYIETECNIGNGRSEMGICGITGNYEYDDGKCDGFGTKSFLLMFA